MNMLVCWFVMLLKSVVDANSTKFTAFESFPGVHETFTVQLPRIRVRSARQVHVPLPKACADALCLQPGYLTAVNECAE